MILGSLQLFVSSMAERCIEHLAMDAFFFSVALLFPGYLG